MRKALIVFALVFALVLGGAAYTFSDTWELRDKVEVTEKPVYGDVTAAEGLSLKMHTNFDDHLFWDIDYTPGEAEKTENDYRVSVKKDYGEYEYIPLGVNLSVEYDSIYFDYIDHEGNISESAIGGFEGIAKAYRELWLETPNGSEGSREIKLKDYYDYYPISGSLEVAGHEVSFDSWAMEHPESYPDADKAYKVFNDYFRIPVLENETRYISLRKDENGNIIGRGGGSGNGENYYLWTHSVVLDDAVYFTVSNRSNEETIVDTSLIPGGFGIYRVPYTVNNGEADIRFEELSTAKSLDEEFDITFFLSDEAGEKLILIGEINSQLHMLIIDAATMDTLQDIEIVSGEKVNCWQYFDGEDFLMLGINDERMALIERQENGEYVLRFVIEDFASREQLYNRYDVQAMAWNGEKLALSGYKSFRSIDERYVADFYYAVYDETGLLCFTDCDSSLCVNADQQWGCVRGNDDGSMKLHWN